MESPPVSIQESTTAIELQEYIARFSASTPSIDLDDARAAEMVGQPVELGKAPPCEAFASLKPLNELIAGVERYHHCTQPHHVKD